MTGESAAIVVAGITAWGTVMVGFLDLRKRTNGQGPIAEKIAELKEDVAGVKADVRDLKADFREHIRRNEGDGR